MKKSKPLTTQEYGLLKQLLQMKQETLLKTTAKTLKKYYGDENVSAYNCGVIAFGDLPVLLVAHLDTVFPKCPSEILYDREQNLIMSPTGLGADDRVGVYMILQLVKAGYRPHVLLCTDEETGGKGAKAFASIPCPFPELRYMVELDRQGENDCVFYDCDNENFTSYVESFGFVEDWGTFSDISVLAPAWTTAAVNLSVGYRDEHTTSEILFVTHMNNTIEKVKKMLENIPTEGFKYIKGKVSNYTKLYEKYFGHTEPSASSEAINCAVCGEPHELADLIATADGDYVCFSCLYNYDKVDWCEECGNAFVKSWKTQTVCQSCLEKEGYHFGGY